jgi:hypothetical protein
MSVGRCQSVDVSRSLSVAFSGEPFLERAQVIERIDIDR